MAKIGKRVGRAGMTVIGAGAFAALSASAWGVAGQDVIVGELPDTANWTPTGPIGGIRAYSVGTTSCNMGDVPLSWISGTNMHPVISGNMYRLVGGRFEMIGQSWLKHGFTALQGTVCGACPNPFPDGTALAPLCSDPYGAGLNGSQGRLGAKSEVNAATGFYPYPFILQGTGDATLMKRLQVHDAELDPTNGLYFVASMYVHPQDAAVGNKHNNESYRRVTVSNTVAKDLTLQGTTQRGRPAIYAWQDHGLGVNTPDPGVIIIQTDIPNDGRFIVASKATTVSAGVWHYEYAIENLNSDRSAQSFSVPLPAGAAVTNVGFHDVDYHSGEPYELNDWTPVVTSDSVTWSCRTFAQTANANALRWGTIYNFRFDCNFPPENLTGTLGLFKPGTPTSASVGIKVPSVNGQTRPSNDDFVFAEPAPAGTTQFSTANATTDGPNEPGACAQGGYTQVGSDVWYRYTAGCTGPVTVSLCGSGFDTKLAIYPSSANTPVGGTSIACNDDDPLCNTGDARQSTATFDATNGQTYVIRIGGVNGQTGSGVMTITPPPCTPQPPPNDARANAAWIGDGVAVTGDTTLATNDGTSTCGSAASSPDVWFKYRPLTSGVFSAATCDSAYNTVVSIHNADTGAQIACNDDAQAGPCVGTTRSYAAIVGTAGQLYNIRVAGSGGVRGVYTLRVTGGGGTVPPVNDSCSTRRGITLGTTGFSTLSSTTDGPVHALCNQNGSDQVTNDIWYNLPTSTNGRVMITATPTTVGYDPRLAVYDGAGCNTLATRLIACNDNIAVGGTQAARVVVSGAAGHNYTLRVGGTNGSSGNGTLQITSICAADYDDGSGTGNPDGGVTIDDLLYYIQVFETGAIAADLDNGSGTGTPDGGVTIDDLLYFIARFTAGC